MFGPKQKRLPASNGFPKGTVRTRWPRAPSSFPPHNQPVPKPKGHGDPKASSRTKLHQASTWMRDQNGPSLAWFVIPASDSPAIPSRRTMSLSSSSSRPSSMTSSTRSSIEVGLLRRRAVGAFVLTAGVSAASGKERPAQWQRSCPLDLRRPRPRPAPDSRIPRRKLRPEHHPHLLPIAAVFSAITGSWMRRIVGIPGHAARTPRPRRFVTLLFFFCDRCQNFRLVLPSGQMNPIRESGRRPLPSASPKMSPTSSTSPLVPGRRRSGSIG